MTFIIESTVSRRWPYVAWCHHGKIIGKANDINTWLGDNNIEHLHEVDVTHRWYLKSRQDLEWLLLKWG